MITAMKKTRCALVITGNDAVLDVQSVNNTRRDKER